MNTQEYNKRCAEFLGMDIGHEKMVIWDRGWTVMKFHSDWNWIMEVVEKVLDACLNLDSMEMYYNITDSIPERHKVAESINQFLIWYNGNNH